MQHLASHGYVVAAPGFPSTRIDAPGGPRLYGVLDQPADVSFVIDGLLSRNGERGFALQDAIDGERIGMTGHSGGGLTTMITAYGERRDERIDAIVPIAPVGCLVPLDIAGDAVVPAMIVGGSEDLLVGPPSIRLAYEAASTPKYFVEIVGGDHVRFGDFDATDADLGDILSEVSDGDIEADLIRTAEGTGADPASCLDDAVKGDALVSAATQRDLLRTAALPFFDHYLKDDTAARRFMDEVLPSLEGIRFEHEGDKPE
jgi:predicted dienelactone hydrolase